MISINMQKARDIGHVLRRAAREAEFAPHDKVIALQIPGDSAAAAEAARAEIRQRYEIIQAAISAATSPEEIKAALENCQA